jgi:predicted Zn finger-like uncharacterized protein
MILTCPACGTNYVVKDGAIPPAGRQVRCASCKHSWHQDPAPLSLEEEAIAGGDQIGIAPPPPPSEPVEEFTGEVPPGAQADGLIAQEPEPFVEPDGREFERPAASMPDDSASQEQYPAATPDEEFSSYAPIARDDEEDTPRRWPAILAILLIIIAAAAAFWFLAPAEWKSRAGIAQAGSTPLQLMITTRDRQRLESGNDLVAISGRVINPTDQEQNVPPIRAELRNSQTRALVHRWTIDPPAQKLAPRSSASFNSAEVDVPRGGDELTVTLGG